MQGTGNSGFQEEKSEERGLPPPYYNPMPSVPPQQYNYPPYQPTTAGIGPQQPLICQPTTNVVVVNTAAAQPTIIAPRPIYKDYMCWSILNIIFCCLPLGICALIFSCKVKSDMDAYDNAAAARSSRTAYYLNLASLLVGITIFIFVILFYAGVFQSR